MQLSEAARTGRRFRRKSDGEDRWYFLDGKTIWVKTTICGNAGQVGWQPNAEELVATDWEAEPKIIKITAKDLLEVAKTLSTDKIVNSRRLSPVELMKMVIVELGLED